MFIRLLHRWMKMMLPAKLFRDHSGLINSGGTAASEIELLQSDDVRPERGNHSRDARLGAATIHAHTAMDVVGHDAQSETVHPLVSATDHVAMPNVFGNPTAAARRIAASELLHGYAFREVTRLIHVTTEFNREVIGE